jgi:hypothetical protein
MVIAIILLPIGTLLSMVLWRVYKMMGRVERILNFVDRVVGYAEMIEQIPLKFIENWLKK